jgi:hypothetical protein
MEIRDCVLRGCHPSEVLEVGREKETTYCRRKFTITEILDDVLVEMAEQHYQGNVSLCLRAAIEDHRATLNGTNTDVLAEKLTQSVESVKTQQEDIITVLQTLEQQLQQKNTDAHRAAECGHMTEFESQVLTSLVEIDTGLRIADLADRLEVRTARLPPALGTLVDRGLVIATGTSPKRFHLAGDTENIPSNETHELLD